MKKDRNTFFQDAHMQSQSYMPNMQMPMMNNNPNMYNQGFAPYQASQASQSFYAGPSPSQNYNQESNYSELDNRLAKIERQINRLDSRITRLENNSNLGLVEKDTNYSSSMYMV